VFEKVNEYTGKKFEMSSNELAKRLTGGVGILNENFEHSRYRKKPPSPKR
jgi:hypothetical protein